jgi:hypothetical protein
LAAPVQVDEAAVAALEPRLAAIVSEIAALRLDVSTLGANASSAATSGPASAEFAALREQIAALAASGPAMGSGSGESGISNVALTQDIDVALRRAEARINEHVDDAVLALAQTLLGKVRGVVSDRDTAPPEQPATGWPEPASEADTAYVEPVYGSGDYSDGGVEQASDVAQADFSAADFADEGPEPVSWSAPAPSYADEGDGDSGDQAAHDAAYLAQTGGVDSPFDQEAAAWAAMPPRPAEGSTAAPDRRRRWFSK